MLPELEQTIRSTWPYDVDRVMMADGALDALDLVTRATLSFGDRVLFEDPTFPAAVDQIEATGADVVGVPSTARASFLTISQRHSSDRPGLFSCNLAARIRPERR